MGLTVTYLNTDTVKSFTEDAIRASGLPHPNAITVHEEKSYDDEDVFVIQLHVKNGDILGTAEQRFETAGRIQQSVWDNGDPRTIFLRQKSLTSLTKQG